MEGYVDSRPGSETILSFDFGSYNWIAIVVAGVAAWIVGAVWFSPPVLGRRWMTALGVKQDQAGNPAPGFVAALVIAIIGATFLRWVLGATGATTIVDGIVVALIIWFAFIMLTGLPGLMFARTPGTGTVFAIVQGQHAIAMIAMGIILTAWK